MSRVSDEFPWISIQLILKIIFVCVLLRWMRGKREWSAHNKNGDEGANGEPMKLGIKDY